MKTLFPTFIILFIFSGCKTVTTETDKFAKISQLHNPIHKLEDCLPNQEVIGIYEFSHLSPEEDSINITIKSGASILNTNKISLLEHSQKKSEGTYYTQSANNIIPISYEIETYKGIDTLNLEIQIERPGQKQVSNSCQIIYHPISDTVNFITYDIKTKFVKYNFLKKFESVDKPLKKNCRYSYKYTQNIRVKKIGDSLNYTLQLKNPTFTESETEKDLNIHETVEVSYNYPSYYDIAEIDKTNIYDFTPRAITWVTDEKIDQYPGYISYFKRIGQEIQGVLYDCDQIDTIQTKDIYIPRDLTPTPFKEEEN